MRLIKLTIVIILGIFAFAACGRGGDAQIMRNPQDLISGTTQEVSSEETTNQNMADDDLYTPTATQSGGTLRILAPTQFRLMLDTAGLEISRTLGVELDITFYDTTTQTPHWAQNLPQAIADGEFDLFFADLRFPLFEMIQDGLLVDIFSIGDFISHDFYLEALQTLTVDNGLYLFPLGFGFQYVSINSNWAPERFVERFNSYETITVSQMMDIYLEIARNHTIHHDMEVDNLQILNRVTTLDGIPGPISLRLSNCRDLTFPEFMVWNAIMDYVDLNNKTSSLTDPGFVAFLEKLLAFFPWEEEPDGIQVYRRFRYNIMPRRSFFIQHQFAPFGIYLPMWLQVCYYWESLEYMFMVHNEFVNPLTPLAPFRTFSYCWSSYGNRGEIIRLNPCADEAFQHFIPLVDEAGRLRTNINTTYPWKTVGIVNGSNTDLAWDFVSRYLIPASTCANNNNDVQNFFRNIGLETVDSPINRSVAANHLSNVFARFREQEQNPWAYDPERNDWFVAYWQGHIGAREASPAEIERAIGRVASQIEEMNEMPMAPVSLIPFELFEPALQNMLRRFASPEATAQIIHDNVIQWMGN